MAGDPTPQTSVQDQWLSRTCSEEEPERQTNTNQHHHRKQDTSQAPTPSLCQSVKDLRRCATASENSDEVHKHPQKFSSEGEAGQNRYEEEGCSIQGAVQGLPMCVHWRDRKNLGEKSKRAQDSSEEE